LPLFCFEKELKNNAIPANPSLLGLFGLSVIILYGHSAASLLLANGFSLKEIQEFLGHGDLGTTANIYAHLQFQAKQDMAASLGEKIAIG
jgi:hypothetical protein